MQPWFYRTFFFFHTSLLTKLKQATVFVPKDQMKIKAIRVFGDNFLHAIAVRFRSERRGKSRSAIQQ
ncbi:MAG: hypothetical protein KatS3mg104_0992 [Phycisphaerae bacterium]|nr:MAG: hypothetical protein KatS3mg104_0992 [Phycisphaerae bacterium]